MLDTRFCVFTDDQAFDGLELRDQVMPRIPDDLTFGICFTYRTRAEAEANARIGGTAFLVGKPIEGLQTPTGGLFYLIYAVTNYHVAWGGTPVLRINRADNRLHIVELAQSDWVPHPGGDDLAVAFLSEKLAEQNGPFDNVMGKVKFVAVSKFATPQILTAHSIGIGDDIFMIGRFLNMQGTKDRLFPAVRLGNISSMPQPVWNSVTNKNQESFAVEMRSRTGFSGSPVAVYRTTESSPIPRDALVPGGPTVQNLWFLLGVNWGFINDADTGENTWLNGVVPAWKILEVLEEPPLKDKQQQGSEAMKRALRGQKPVSTPAIALPETPSATPATDANPKHREDFNSLVGAAAQKREQAG